MARMVYDIDRDSRRDADARGVPASVMAPRLLLIAVALLLTMLGLVMVFSASTVESISQGKGIFSYVSKQAFFAITGVGIAVVLARVPYHVWLGRATDVVWVAALLSLFAVAFAGKVIYGAKRWLIIGPISIQPSEFVKIAYVLLAVRIMVQWRDGTLRGKGLALSIAVGLLLPILILYRTQSDLGSTMIIAVGILAVLWFGEIPLRYFLGAVVLIVCAGIFTLTVGYRSDRISVWLDPWNDGQGGYGTGFQMIRSFYAFSSGGLFGLGLGNSHEKFLYLPEAETDFIYSIIGEELGFIGAFAVIVLFLAFLYAGLRIADGAPDEFGRLMASSLTVMLVFQAFLNMACATGILPTTGKPLPFISSGGSSLWSSFIVVGLLLSISHGSNVLTPHERRRNDFNVVAVDRGARGGSARPSRMAGGAADEPRRRLRNASDEPRSSRMAGGATLASPRRTPSDIGLAGGHRPRRAGREGFREFEEGGRR